MSRFSTEPTPNPDSLKITTKAGAFISRGMESFSSADQARDHPLGSRLFAVPGVANVFILPEFLTITKDRSASWNGVLPAVEAVLDDYFSGE